MLTILALIITKILVLKIASAANSTWGGNSEQLVAPYYIDGLTGEIMIDENLLLSKTIFCKEFSTKKRKR